MNILNPIRNIMTKNVKVIMDDTIMTEVAELFERYEFHHLPVIDQNGTPVGLISKHDFYRMQDPFTMKGLPKASTENRMYFRSLIASEVMATPPICLEENQSIKAALEIFELNKVHSIMICKDGLITGILTTHDIIKHLVNSEVLN